MYVLKVVLLLIFAVVGRIAAADGPQGPPPPPAAANDPQGPPPVKGRMPPPPPPPPASKPPMQPPRPNFRSEFNSASASCLNALDALLNQTQNCQGNVSASVEQSLGSPTAVNANRMAWCAPGASSCRGRLVAAAADAISNCKGDNAGSAANKTAPSVIAQLVGASAKAGKDLSDAICPPPPSDKKCDDEAVLVTSAMNAGRDADKQMMLAVCSKCALNSLTETSRSGSTKQQQLDAAIAKLSCADNNNGDVCQTEFSSPNNTEGIAMCTNCWRRRVSKLGQMDAGQYDRQQGLIEGACDKRDAGTGPSSFCLTTILDSLNITNSNMQGLQTGSWSSAAVLPNCTSSCNATCRADLDALKAKVGCCSRSIPGVLRLIGHGLRRSNCMTPFNFGGQCRNDTKWELRVTINTTDPVDVTCSKFRMDIASSLGVSVNDTTCAYLPPGGAGRRRLLATSDGTYVGGATADPDTASTAVFYSDQLSGSVTLAADPTMAPTGNINPNGETTTAGPAGTTAARATTAAPANSAVARNPMIASLASLATFISMIVSLF